ncbi:hypothetical protein GH5_00094 [Leishmania sp. Ghana 2012 LV757]|uniref:hypothetical protein n=1 Tax=Leishmania sp. Ghana 2012 LV757 TaxID=2803181 RepID=UPI001B42D5B1|nr:hypothetical protein GH5_00094 [Leishmania sp. Ghana 2012 LV757]
MSTVGVDASGREVRVRLPPGVYRAAYSAPPTEAGTDVSRTFTEAMPPKGAVATFGDTQRRFHQLRDLRREFSGRPRPSTGVEPAAAAPAACALFAAPSLLTKDALPPALSLTRTPAAASFGLPLDRLAADEPATRCILRIAAAERALRLQQAENDELKRAMVSQQEEAARMQVLMDRLSSELSEANQTVLRQTVTMKSLAAEMERRDVYHLIKEKRSSQTVASAAATANTSLSASSSQSPFVSQERAMQLAQQVEQLTREKTELQRQLSQLSSRHGGKLRSTPAIEAIDKDDDATGEVSGAEGWVPSARAELQRLVRSLAALLRTGASLPARVGPDFEPVYEVELSCLTCLAPLGTPRNALVAESAPAKASFVVCAYGPYNMQDLLLRAPHTDRKLGSVLGCCRMVEEVPLQSLTRCVFYAMRDTCGVVRICWYENVADTEVNTVALCSAELPAPAATATIAVHTLIATTLASRRELEPMQATYSVHTVHLTAEKGTPCGTVSFRVRVTEVWRRRYRDYGGTSRIDSHADHRRRKSPFSAPLPGESSGVGSGERSTTPLKRADAGLAEGESLTQHWRRRQSRGPTLSPSRYEAATPFTRQHLFVNSSLSPSTAPSAALDDADPRYSSEDATNLRQEAGPQAELPPALSAPAEGTEGASTRVAATPSDSVSNHDAAPYSCRESHDRDDSRSASTKATTLKALGGAAVPLPQRAGLLSPPPSAVADLSAASTSGRVSPLPPPAAIAPAPPRSLTTTAAPSAPIDIAMRMHIKEVRYTHEGCCEEMVEDMLDQRSLQVVVRIDGELVFAAPTRRNPSHAVWGAEEGTFTSTLTAGQEVCFEVGDGDTVQCKGVLLASEILNRRGERDVTLVSVSGGQPCGLLSLAFEGSG